MRDLSHPGWIKAKGILFLALGLLSAALLLFDHPSLKTGSLLALAIWCFCRFYYFAFYVIEKYVDPSYRFSGLGSFVRYVIFHKRKPEEKERGAVSVHSAGSNLGSTEN